MYEHVDVVWLLDLMIHLNHFNPEQRPTVLNVERLRIINIVRNVTYVSQVIKS